MNKRTIMASFCGSHYASCQETTNFARICRIVVDVLRDVLWQVLIHEIPAADLPNRVQTNQNNLRNLDVKIKTWLCGISPSSPEIPIAEKFDVSSLYTLIRNLCSQVPTPSTQWGQTPPPGGTTLGDDIERVREFRNTLYGHATKAKINTKDFNKQWINIRNVVKRFDVYFSSSCKAMKCDFDKEICKILTCSMDKSLQDAYMEKEKEIKMLSDDLKKVKQQVGNVKQDVDDIKQLVGALVQDVCNVKQEVGSVNQILQNNIDVVKKDIDQIKETLQKPNVQEKGNICRQELQTKEFISASDGSNQPISQNESSLQSFQIGEQKSNVKTEESPVQEACNDTEADKQEPVIPVEILRMDEGSIQMFKEALKDRTVKVYNIRVMIVGQYGVGKTTLSKRLLGDDVNISERKSTEGIDVHIHRCRVSLATHEWLKQDKDAELNDKLQRYCKLLNDQSQGLDIGDEQAGNSKVMYQMDTALDIKENVTHHVESTNLVRDQKRVETSSSKPTNLSYETQSNNEDNEGLNASSKVMPGNKGNSFNNISKEHLKASHKAMPGDKKNSFSNISKEDFLQMLDQSVRNADKSDNKDTVKNILQFLKENSDKLVISREEYAPLAMWDFAGQYVYYTTHQTFLTQRAIYLLVLDLTKQATDQVKDDDCFFDIEGKKECQVYDLAEIWLNSIHSCAPFPESHNPPVILVGSHMDKFQQDKRQERSESIFQQIRSHDLRGRPARLHLADQDFSIDNTIEDPVIKDLQKKIVEIASKQPHWGESIPGRWLPLEEWLMNLKAKGVKVIPYHLLEMMNLEGEVKIESKEELSLFLKFQHDIGNILYFSTEELRGWIVLEPQWLIKAMKSLITADMFILRKYPQAEKVWHQFKEEGKLTLELLDIIWSKEHEPDLYNHKELILLLMQQLNIIARPMLFIEDGDKEDDFFLAPCMLCQTAPPKVISPDVKPEMESSSVLCFVFMGKFLPSPIFHRLLAVCVAKWPILKRRGANQIFCGCGLFEIDSHYRLTLYFKSYVIFARITHAAAKLQKLDAKVCIPVRKFINDNLSKILGNLSQNLKFEFSIQCQCPQSVGDCLDNLFSVKELSNVANLICRYHDDHSVESNSLLKYWFQNEELYSKDTPSQIPPPVPPRPLPPPVPLRYVPPPPPPLPLRSPVRSLHSSLPPILPGNKVSERQLGRMSVKIGYKYAPLDLELGLSGEDIQQIQKAYPHKTTQCLMILFKWMQRNGDKATFGNLEMAFKRADINVDILKSVNTIGHTVSCLPPSMLEKQPEDRHLKWICSRIGTQHVLLGVELVVPLSRIDQILKEHPTNVQRQCFEIMKEWRQRQASWSTFRHLEQAFKCVGISSDILKQSVN